jgi:hypothetical protein
MDTLMRMILVGHETPMREKKDSYKILAGKSQINEPLAKSRNKWKGIKMDFKEAG